MNDWTTIRHFPHLEFWESPDKTYYQVRRKGDPDSAVIVENRDELAQWIANNSANPDHLPIGDLVHKVAEILGFKRCTPCAERQARLNRWLKR